MTFTLTNCKNVCVGEGQLLFPVGGLLDTHVLVVDVCGRVVCVVFSLICLFQDSLHFAKGSLMKPEIFWYTLIGSLMKPVFLVHSHCHTLSSSSSGVHKGTFLDATRTRQSGRRRGPERESLPPAVAPPHSQSVDFRYNLTPN